LTGFILRNFARLAVCGKMPMTMAISGRLPVRRKYALETYFQPKQRSVSRFRSQKNIVVETYWKISRSYFTQK